MSDDKQDLSAISFYANISLSLFFQKSYLILDNSRKEIASNENKHAPTSTTRAVNALASSKGYNYP